jgi:hypothetical protein
MPEVALENAAAIGRIIERAMRHTSPETKRIYQLSMVEQVREAMEKSSQKVYDGHVTVHWRVLQDTNMKLEAVELKRENGRFVCT